MNFKKLFRTLALGSVILAWSFPAIGFAQDVKVLIHCNKPYASLVAKVKAAGGKVRRQYRYVNGIAATIPENKLNEIAKSPEVLAWFRDQQIVLPQSPIKLRNGASLPTNLDVEADNLKGFSKEELLSLTAASPDNYFPFQADITNARDFWTATGNLGSGVIIGIMDSGFRPNFAIAARIVGGESFTAPIGDLLPAVHPSNGPHGSWVAHAAVGNVSPLFGGTLPSIVNTHLPGNVIPEPGFPFPAVGRIPLVGTAPGANIFAFKVFNPAGVTTESIILTAMDRTIELKDNFNKGMGGVNIQVLNMSFGGASLFAGEDPFFAGMMKKLIAVGIVPVTSAGNDGPGGMSGGDPGLGKNILTCGATDPYQYERIVVDAIPGAFFFPPFPPNPGTVYRANTQHFVADFSSRGPTADGRSDPEIVAPGKWLFAQTSATGFSFISGTSFSAPQVAGAAALLRAVYPNATVHQIRGALVKGANPNLLNNHPGKQDQGFGFLDVLQANQLLSAGNVINPADRGRAKSSIKDNIRPLGFPIIHSHFWTRNTGRLLPGQRAEYYFAYDPQERDHIDIDVSVTAVLPPAQQNQAFGDDIWFTVHSAKTSSFNGAEYLVGQFVGGTASFHLDNSILDKGILRVTVLGDWTNAGEVFAVVTTKVGNDDLEQDRFASGEVIEAQTNVHTLVVPPGLPSLEVMLTWDRDWESYPTDDLDLIVISPSNVTSFLGATIDSPERFSIAAPEAGTWTFLVDGFTVWQGETAEYKLYVNEDVLPKLAPQADQITATVPIEFGLEQNYPNPFNPSTKIAYQVAKPTEVNIQIYDLNGQLVKTLINEYKQPGAYSAIWNGRDRRGQIVASGVYLYRITAGDFVDQKRMAFVK